jgi:hypothetical protein
MFDEEPKDYQAAWEKRKRRIIELEEPSENSIAVRFYESYVTWAEELNLHSWLHLAWLSPTLIKSAS